jgi:CPA1 family monovalent cation:H+ antiporter
MGTFQLSSLLICLAALFSFINFKFIRLPSTIGVMLMALGTSTLLFVLGSFARPLRIEAQSIVASVDFREAIFNGMLAFLLFAGALQMQVDDLRREWKPIAVLALLGTVVSTALVGFLCWITFRFIGLPLSFAWCLVFGALISPTDPNAVLGIMRKVGAPKGLETIMAGESLFNDGVGVAIFLGVASMVVGETTPTIPQGVLLLIREAAGGAGVGLATGLLTYVLLTTVDNYQVEVLLTLGLAMGCYALADSIGTSGPIAVVVAGVFIGNRGRAMAMSEKTRQHLDSFWELIEETLNSVLFLLLGLEMLVVPFSRNFVAAGIISIAVVLLARWICVAGSFSLLSLWYRSHPGRITILTWGGLRGGLSVAMVLSLPPSSNRNLLLVITYAVVLFCVFVQGLTASAVIRHAVRVRPP